VGTESERNSALLVGHPLRDVEAVDVAVRDPDELGVRAGEPAEGVAVAGDRRRRVAEHGLGELWLRMGVVAQRPQLVLAVPADPQVVVSRTLRTTSCGLTMRGSGTLLTCRSLTPIQHSALMTAAPRRRRGRPG
jgi:hypothetical protein